MMAAAAGCLGTTLATGAEPKIEWESAGAVESRMPSYKYTRSEPEYNDAKKDGSNYGCVGLTIEPGAPRLLDRVLARNARLTGRIAGVPAEARAGRVWIEDNYGRVLDQAEVRGGDFPFRLDASRSLKTGLYLKAELTDGAKPVWNGEQPLRMVPMPEDDPWGDFILGIYNMGTKPGTGELFRRLGLGHRAVQTTGDPAPAVGNDLRFHASNILYSLLGLYHRDAKRWREIREAENVRREAVSLQRHRCLSDPREQQFARDILTAAAMRFRPYQPLHYSIGDEIGIGDMAAPHDLCACQWCLPRYRRWLAARYRTIGELNAEWGTQYESFDKVEMMSTWQALERADSANFSPWADRLEFMDEVLYSFIADCVATVRKFDPDATCNISGFQQPSCWGFNHWRLSQTVNCCSPYEIGESPDILQSFWNDGRDGKIHMPGFGADTEGLWRSFVRGYNLAAQWDSNPPTYSALIDIEQQALTPFGQKVREFAEWVHAGPGRLRALSVRRRDPVAILYSQPSLRGNWILEATLRKDIPQTGAEWVTRGSWSVRQREASFRVRVSWVQWLHDVGIWPRFVDVSQLEQGFLEANGYRVLVLPRAVALSQTSADAVRRFAEAGGTVIADSWTGLMDEHCRLRPGGTGALDNLFGVRRDDWRTLDVARLAPGEAGVKVGGVALPFTVWEATLKSTTGKAGGAGKTADAGVTRAAGKGRAIYLNFDMESYFLHRLTPDMVDPARRYLLGLMAEAGVRPLFSVVPPDGARPFHAAGHDVCVYANGRGYLVAAMQNPSVMHSDVGGLETRYTEIKGNVFTKDHAARLVLPETMFVYEITERKAAGKVDAVDFVSPLKKARCFACWPFRIDGVEATASVKEGRLKVAGRVRTSAPVERERLAVAVEAFRPDGSRQAAYCRTVDCKRNEFEVDFPLGRNEHGDWSIVVREPCTGSAATTKQRIP
jgi:hypothetical protein